MRSPFNQDKVDASMGIYLFNTDALLPALIRDAEDPNSEHDFGHNVLPAMLGQYKMYAFNFVDENKQEACTGGMWERSMPIMTPIWTSPR